jgi:hypothetical protein
MWGSSRIRDPGKSKGSSRISNSLVTANLGRITEFSQGLILNFIYSNYQEFEINSTKKITKSSPTRQEATALLYYLEPSLTISRKSQTKSFQVLLCRFTWLDWPDPGGHLRWLVHELLTAELNSERVYVVGHVSPGLKGMSATWSHNFNRIVVR